MKKINSNLFKQAMSKFATGLTIISINKKNRFIGKTVNSLASLSLNPPLILFSLDKKSSSLNDFKYSIFIGVNILAKNQKILSKRFSNKKPSWGNTNFFLNRNNIPMIKGSIVNLNCKKIKTITQGDHIIFICQIIEVKIDNKTNPLIYINSKYI